eukprot:15364899-Ditylum_brightwellii.AAC.2
MLWPYALKAAEVHFNKYNIDEEGVSPEEKFWTPPPLWEYMVRLGNAYMSTPETTVWELLDDVTQVPPSVEPICVEQLLV